MLSCARIHCTPHAKGYCSKSNEILCELRIFAEGVVDPPGVPPSQLSTTSTRYEIVARSAVHRNTNRVYTPI